MPTAPSDATRQPTALADYVQRVVTTAPPLDDERRDRLATLLRPRPLRAAS